ncbi:hypothetical protein GCK72_004372 [Caenorhabditis remanei]|uniref:Uncharacterized protein n=1 Tax=Caenorhabditis remanei TaxID=31234 RepID=A0A6A5HC77_CAERE|nr:hypothetical protein GCK72_004372 [Caenorhabditis remanei]KAF1764424.1 hypothetical protein GCK72_004372 [Caenorhabditis remanei]
MPVIPVQYENLKAILPYMDPNTRFQISSRMPSISSLESRIPLKVENLTFAGPFTEVNKVSYELAVYRDYGRNETPSDVHHMNQCGGSSHDIDQYGLIIFPGLNKVLPGDTDLRTTVHRDVPVYTEEWKQGLVQQLRILKLLLAERLNKEYIEDDETRNAGVGFNETFRQNVTYWNSLALERFKNIIHPSSLPIRRLKVSSSVFAADFQHAIAREAKYLIINNIINDNRSWTPILLNLTSRRVFLENENRLNPPNNYMGLIENWLERGRPVGTTYSMGIKSEVTVKQCLDTLKQRQEVIGSSEKQVQLRINASLMLNVSYEAIEQPGRLPRDDQSKWWLILKVVRGRSE